MLTLFLFPFLECEVNWNPHSAGCVAFECGAGAVLQVRTLSGQYQFLKSALHIICFDVPKLKGSVQVCYPGPIIKLEIKLVSTCIVSYP
jgi:hypothetical protein